MNFEKLKKKYQRQYNANLVVGIALIIVGLATVGIRVMTSALLILMGFSLIAMARKNNARNIEEIAKIKSPEEFDKSMETSLLEMREFSLYISDKYTVSELRGLQVFPMGEMKKFQVGIAGDKKKSLFLTDMADEMFEIASTVKGDKRQESFDQAYYKVKDIFDNKKFR